MPVYFPFIGAAALLLILPGPTNALLLAAGASQPPYRALPLILAELVAYGLAISPLLVFNEVLGSWRETGGLALRCIALAMILLLAWRMWRRAGEAVGASGPVVTMSSVFWVTLFNPKSLVFAFAVFPPVGDAADAVLKAALFIVLAVLAGSAWVTMGAVLTGGGRRMRNDRIARGSALLLCGFAIYLGASVVTGAATLIAPEA